MIFFTEWIPDTACGRFRNDIVKPRGLPCPSEMNTKSIVKLKDGETVVRIVRNFWLTYVGPFLFAFLLFAAPFFLMIPLFKMGSWGLGVFVVSLVAGLLVALRQAIIWYWNASVVTTQRVVDIDQRGFFDRTVSEAVFEKIQDVSYRVKGFWNTMLNFGTVVIQTAGATTNIELTNVRDPKEVHHLITEKMAARASGTDKPAPSLVSAAADMSDAEARAFLVELQEKISDGKEERDERTPRFTKKPLNGSGPRRHPLDPPDLSA